MNIVDNAKKENITKVKSKRALHHVNDAIIKGNMSKEDGLEDNCPKYIFANRLNEELVKKGMAQIDLQDKTNLASGTISAYRNGKTEPTLTNLTNVAKVLNVSVDYLVGLVNEPTNDIDKKAVCEYTGLSQETIECLNHFTISRKNISKHLDIIIQSAIQILKENAK